jgi:hypothetical protein
MRQIGTLLLLIVIFLACNSDKVPEEKQPTQSKNNDIASEKHFEGEFSNGMKGDKISFDISPDGKKLENLTFIGYWRCAGKLEQTTTGPEGAFDIVNGKAKGSISEPPNGGSTAWRFEIDATINGNKAEGTFRMNINNLGCDSYLLKWTASAK